MTHPLKRWSAGSLALLGLICGLSGCASHVPWARGDSHQVPDWMVASWYGEPFHGHKTASGEIFNMHARTAAHKTLPFGTRLRVTYPRTGQSTIVTINDRGPFVAGRDLDLSKAAAQDIGLIREGVGRVRVERLGQSGDHRIAGPPDSTPRSHAVVIQLNSFSQAANAQAFLRQVQRTHPHAFIQQAHVGSTVVHRVRLGPFANQASAQAELAQLQALGYQPRILSAQP